MCQAVILPNFCRKLHENERILTWTTPLDPPLEAVVNKKPTNRTVSKNIVLLGVSGGFGSPDPPPDKEKKSDDKTQKSHTTTPTDETKKEENDREEDLTDDELGLGDPHKVGKTR